LKEENLIFKNYLLELSLAETKLLLDAIELNPIPIFWYCLSTAVRRDKHNFDKNESKA